MSGINRCKTLETFLICYIIIGIALWFILFIYSPRYVVFLLSNEEAQKVSTIKNSNVIIKDLNGKDFDKYLETVNMVSKTQDYVGGPILLYGVAGFFMLISYGHNILNRIYLPIIIFVFSINYYIANKYYNFVFKPFINFLNDYLGYFIFIRCLPSLLIGYLIFRSVFCFFFKEEPKFVGKIASLYDPMNWLFTSCVLIFGVIVGFVIPWI